MTHDPLVCTYARTFDGPRFGAWSCSCGAREDDLPNQRTATTNARRHVAAQGELAS